MSLNSTQTTSNRKKYLKTDCYLRRLYTFWYKKLITNIVYSKNSQLLELGSGGGFLKELAPNVVTSDILSIPGVDRIVDARNLPFKNKTLNTILGINVLHHIPEISKFFKEADRVLISGGRLVFIEPWPTPFSVAIYRSLHHEPFDMSSDWSIPPGGPLTAANGALPWIIFSRDRRKFKNDYPRLRIIKTAPFMSLSYLVSGGIERRWPLPPWVFPLVRFLERPFDLVGLFALIVVEKTEG